MTSTKWLRRFYRFSRRPLPVKIRSAVRRVSLAVESLEDRAVPAGLVVTDLTAGVTPAAMVQSLLGPGVSVSNFQFTGYTGTASNDVKNGDSSSAGMFTGGTGIIGFDSGIILSSGGVQNVVGPNTSDSISQVNSLPGDPNLDALTSGTTFDATVLEFDFTPTFNTITFQYVFASDEYNEWANTPFNDVFGFYLNGSNVALLPSTDTASNLVSINNVNGGNPVGTDAHNAAFFINNDLASGAALNTEMDGLTKVLSVVANVIPNQVNHIKLAIADTSDSIYDSNVFIKATSFTKSEIELSPDSGTGLAGGSHSVTATITDSADRPVPNLSVNFLVNSGPDKGTTGTGATDANGKATFTYTNTGGAGTDTIVAQFTDGAGQLVTSAPATQTWTTTGELPPTVTPPADQTSAEGISKKINLGTLTDSEGGPWAVTVNWNDGGPNSSIDSVTSEGPLGALDHNFVEDGTYAVMVTVTDTANGQSASATFNVVVADLPVVAQGVPALTTVRGVGLSDGTVVATFVDPGGSEPSPADRTPDTVDGHYTATIDWGDHSHTSSGALSYSGTPGSATDAITVSTRIIFTPPTALTPLLSPSTMKARSRPRATL